MVGHTLIKEMLQGTYRITSDGALYRKTPKGWVKRKTWLNNKGYECIDIRRNKQRKHYLVHRLVAQAFIPNPEGLTEVNHKDENKLNNCVDNLEWCTHSYNNTYGTKIERFKETFKKICQEQGGPRQQACICLETGERFNGAKWAAQAFGVPHARMIRACLYGRKIGGKYHFKYVKDL